MSDPWQETADGGSPTEPPRLSERQERALETLLSRPTIEAAAKAAGVGARTLHRWLKEPAFRDAYREARAETVRQVTVRLQQAAGSAVDALTAVMSDDSAPQAARVSAARVVLETTYRALELEDLDERLRRLEARH